MINARALVVVLFSLLTFSVFGQKGGKVSGSVVNSATGTGLEYASVSILDGQGKKVLNGTISDPKGAFSVTGIAPGSYVLKVESVGFTTVTKKITVEASGAVVGAIGMTASSTSLGVVTVTASKPLVESHIDKMVYNAANDVTSQSGVALDVLKKVPSVSVDIDGNVELEGNANIRFLINGKPSTIFGSSLADALQSIPASQIKSVEVISSPGARYDASGTGGIINIILKDNKVKGINGSANASVGTRLENGSFNLNIRQSNFGVNAFFSGNAQLNTTTLNTIDRTSYNTAKDTLTLLHQDGSTAFRREGYQTGIGFDWDISSRDKLTAGFSFNHFGNKTSGTTDQLQSVTDGSGNAFSTQPSVRNSLSKVAENASDWSLDYKKQFPQKGEELEFLATTSFGKNTSNYYQQQVYTGTTLPVSGSRGSGPGTDRETDLALDYTLPLGKDAKLETGGKGVFEDLRSQVVTDTLMPDLSYQNNADQTYGFTYHRQVYAYYVSGDFTLFHKFLEGQAGLRYEYTHMSADFKGASIPSYGTFFPSLVLVHHLDETQSIKAAWGYRIERPDYGDLNPFYNISDPHNISSGNPALKPEKGVRYELTYEKSFGRGTNLIVTGFYRYNTDDIQSIATYYSSLLIDGVTYTDVSLSQRYNVGWQKNIGGNITGSAQVTPALSLRTNIMLREGINESPGLGKVSGFGFRGNLNATYKFGHDIIAEVFGNYVSSQKNIQGLRPAFGFYTLAVKKDFWHKNATLGLTATNPFNKYIDQRSTLFGSDFYQEGLRRVPYQSFGLVLAFKFGKLAFKEKEKPGNGEPVQID